MPTRPCIDLAGYHHIINISKSKLEYLEEKTKQKIQKKDNEKKINKSKEFQ